MLLSPGDGELVVTTIALCETHSIEPQIKTAIIPIHPIIKTFSEPSGCIDSKYSAQMIRLPGITIRFKIITPARSPPLSTVLFELGGDGEYGEGDVETAWHSP